MEERLQEIHTLTGEQYVVAHNQWDNELGAICGAQSMTAHAIKMDLLRSVPQLDSGFGNGPS